MSNSIFLNIVTRSVVLAAVVATFGIYLTPRASAQSTAWTITVDVRSGQEKPNYTVSSVPAGASNCLPANPNPPLSPEHLYICAGDSVYWTLMTNGKKGKLSVYQKDFFIYKATTPTKWFHADEGKQSDGGTTDVNGTKGQEHEYSVAVFDDNSGNSHLYVHDPKIIIGTGVADAVVRKMERICDQKPTESEAVKLCKEVENLIKLLYLGNND